MTTKVQLFYDKIMNDPDIIPPAGKKKEDIALAIAEQRVKQSENNNKALNMAKSSSPVKKLSDFIQLEKAPRKSIDTGFSELNEALAIKNREQFLSQSGYVVDDIDTFKNDEEGITPDLGTFKDIHIVQFLSSLSPRQLTRLSPKQQAYMDETIPKLLEKYGEDVGQRTKDAEGNLISTEKPILVKVGKTEGEPNDDYNSRKSFFTDIDGAKDNVLFSRLLEANTVTLGSVEGFTQSPAFKNYFKDEKFKQAAEDNYQTRRRENAQETYDHVKNQVIPYLINKSTKNKALSFHPLNENHAQIKPLLNLFFSEKSKFLFNPIPEKNVSETDDLKKPTISDYGTLLTFIDHATEGLEPGTPENYKALYNAVDTFINNYDSMDKNIDTSHEDRLTNAIENKLFEASESTGRYEELHNDNMVPKASSETTAFDSASSEEQKEFNTLISRKQFNDFNEKYGLKLSDYPERSSRNSRPMELFDTNKFMSVTDIHKLSNMIMLVDNVFSKINLDQTLENLEDNKEDVLGSSYYQQATLSKKNIAKELINSSFVTDMISPSGKRSTESSYSRKFDEDVRNNDNVLSQELLDTHTTNAINNLEKNSNIGQYLLSNDTGRPIVAKNFLGGKGINDPSEESKASIFSYNMTNYNNIRMGFDESMRDKYYPAMGQNDKGQDLLPPVGIDRLNEWLNLAPDEGFTVDDNIPLEHASYLADFFRDNALSLSQGIEFFRDPDKRAKFDIVADELVKEKIGQFIANRQAIDPTEQYDLTDAESLRSVRRAILGTEGTPQSKDQIYQTLVYDDNTGAYAEGYPTKAPSLLKEELTNEDIPQNIKDANQRQLNTFHLQKTNTDGTVFDEQAQKIIEAPNADQIADDQANQDAFNAAREKVARSSVSDSSYVLPATTPTLNANHINNFLNKLSSYQASLFGEDTNLDMDEAELQNFFDRLSEEPSNPQEVRTKLNPAAAKRLYNHFKETAETLGLTEGDDPQVTIPTEEEFINSFVNRDRENPINPKFLSDLRTVYLKNRAEVRQAAGIPPIAEQIDMFNPPQNNEQQSFIEEGGDTEGEVTEEVNTDVTEVVPTGEGSIETETTDTTEEGPTNITEGGTTEEGPAGEKTGVVDNATEVVDAEGPTTEKSIIQQVSDKREEINERGEREYVDPDDLPEAERSSESPARTYEKLHPEELPLINEWLGLKGDNQLTVDDDLTHDHLEHLDEWLNNDAHGHDEGVAFFRDPTKRNRFNSSINQVYQDSYRAMITDHKRAEKGESLAGGIAPREKYYGELSMSELQGDIDFADERELSPADVARSKRQLKARLNRQQDAFDKEEAAATADPEEVSPEEVGSEEVGPGEGGNDVDDASISGEPIDPTNVERYLSEYGRAVETLTSDHLRLQQFNYDRNVNRDKRFQNTRLDRERSKWQEEQGYYDTAEDLFEGSERSLYKDTHDKLLETQQTLAGIYETMAPEEQQKITDILKNPSLLENNDWDDGNYIQAATSGTADVDSLTQIKNSILKLNRPQLPDAGLEEGVELDSNFYEFAEPILTGIVTGHGIGVGDEEPFQIGRGEVFTPEATHRGEVWAKGFTYNDQVEPGVSDDDFQQLKTDWAALSLTDDAADRLLALSDEQQNEIFNLEGTSDFTALQRGIEERVNRGESIWEDEQVRRPAADSTASTTRDPNNIEVEGVDKLHDGPVANPKLKAAENHLLLTEPEVMGSLSDSDRRDLIQTHADSFADASKINADMEKVRRVQSEQKTAERITRAKLETKATELGYGRGAPNVTNEQLEGFIKQQEETQAKNIQLERMEDAGYNTAPYNDPNLTAKQLENKANSLISEIADRDAAFTELQNSGLSADEIEKYTRSTKSEIQAALKAQNKATLETAKQEEKDQQQAHKNNRAEERDTFRSQADDLISKPHSEDSTIQELTEDHLSIQQLLEDDSQEHDDGNLKNHLTASQKTKLSNKLDTLVGFGADAPLSAGAMEHYGTDEFENRKQHLIETTSQQDVEEQEAASKQRSEDHYNDHISGQAGFDERKKSKEHDGSRTFIEYHPDGKTTTTLTGKEGNMQITRNKGENSPHHDEVDEMGGDSKTDRDLSNLQTSGVGYDSKHADDPELHEAKLAYKQAALTYSKAEPGSYEQEQAKATMESIEEEHPEMEEFASKIKSDTELEDERIAAGRPPQEVPPRPGLVWNPENHHWVKPENYEGQLGKLAPGQSMYLSPDALKDMFHLDDGVSDQAWMKGALLSSDGGLHPVDHDTDIDTELDGKGMMRRSLGAALTNAGLNMDSGGKDGVTLDDSMFDGTGLFESTSHREPTGKGATAQKGSWLQRWADFHDKLGDRYMEQGKATFQQELARLQGESGTLRGAAMRGGAGLTSRLARIVGSVGKPGAQLAGKGVQTASQKARSKSTKYAKLEDVLREGVRVPTDQEKQSARYKNRNTKINRWGN